MGVLTRRIVALAIAALLATGCVFEGRCVEGARRESNGRCALHAADAGGDSGGSGHDAGDAGSDAGTPRRIVDVAIGGAWMCAIDDQAALSCWGANLFGALATGDVSPRGGPVPIDLGADVLDVHTTALHVCATTSAPSLYCWGDDVHGQIGDGTPGDEPTLTPFRVEGLGSLRAVVTGFANTCAVSYVGVARCWGRNDEGQLGIGTAGEDLYAPGRPVQSGLGPDSPLELVQDATIADRHICVRGDGSVYCVGLNDKGQLGDGTRTSSAIPVRVNELDGVTDVSSSFEGTCAVSDGRVYCWGDGTRGGLHPTMAEELLSPVYVDLGEDAVQVVRGQQHTCALLASGAVRCWGSDVDGQLGDAATGGEMVGVVEVEGLPSNVERLVSNGLTLTCALTDDGELWCWGTDSVVVIDGPAPGAATVFLDGETRHDTPVRVDPFR